LQPAKQATASSLGRSEALRAQPQDPSIKEAQARETGDSAQQFLTLPPASQARIFISSFPMVSLAKPRSTIGYMLAPAPQAN